MYSAIATEKHAYPVIFARCIFIYFFILKENVNWTGFAICVLDFLTCLDEQIMLR